MQLVALLSGCVLPAGHGMHADCLASGWWLPGLHGVGAVAAVAQLEPAGHGVHAAALAKSVLLENVPALHGRAAVPASGHQNPRTQAMQLVVPSCGW